MEVQANEGTQQSSTPAPASAPESVAKAPSASPSPSTQGKQSTKAPEVKATDTGNQGDGIDNKIVPPAFKPNLKYKVGGSEKQFDEFLHAVIKDEETEKKIRKLYEDAEGVNFMKQDRQRVLEAFNEIYPQHQELTQRVSRLQGFLDEGNFGAFQREVGIPNEAILRRAQQILAAMENPALKSQEDKEYSQLESMQTVQSENQRLINQVAQARATELDMVLSRPEVLTVAEAFDAKMGQIGAFKREVINRGSMYSQFYKVDKSAKELVDEMLGFMGVTGAAPQGQPQVLAENYDAAPGHEKAQVQGTVVVPPKKPAIPNITGKGTSPVKKTFTSLDQLKEHARNFNG